MRALRAASGAAASRSRALPLAPPPKLALDWGHECRDASVINDLSWDSSGAFLAAAGDDAVLRVFGASGRLLREFDSGARVIGRACGVPAQCRPGTRSGQAAGQAAASANRGSETRAPSSSSSLRMAAPLPPACRPHGVHFGAAVHARQRRRADDYRGQRQAGACDALGRGASRCSHHLHAACMRLHLASIRPTCGARALRTVTPGIPSCLRASLLSAASAPFRPARCVSLTWSAARSSPSPAATRACAASPPSTPALSCQVRRPLGRPAPAAVMPSVSFASTCSSAAAASALQLTCLRSAPAPSLDTCTPVLHTRNRGRRRRRALV